MSVRNNLLCAAALCFALCVPASAEVAIKSPTQVQKALETLNRVVDHTGRLISEKKFADLPGENNEFREGATALQKVLADEPSELKVTVEPMLQRASMDSQGIADAATSRNEAKLVEAHAALASSVGRMIAAFPANVHPLSPSLAKEKQEEKARQP